MNSSQSNFQSHPVHKTLNDLVNIIHENADTSNKNSPSSLAKLYKILTKTRITVQSIDPDFYPTKELDKIESLLKSDEFIIQFSNAINRREGFDYQTANSTLEELAESVYKLSGMTDKSEDIELLKKIESNFSRRYQAKEKELIDIKLTLEFELEETREKINNIQLLESELRERSKQTKEILDKNQSLMISEQKSRISEFSKEQADRQASFKSQSDQMLRMISSNAEKAYTSQEETIKQKTTQLLKIIEKSEDDIKEKHQSIKDIHELVAEDGIAGGYKKNAEDEKKAANMWRWITLGCYSLILLWVLFKNLLGFETFINNEAQWPVLAITISITAIALIAANFSAKQSRIHATNEHKMRWFALEVKAIDPFISSLPEPEKTELKKQLSEKLFCQTKSDEATNQTDNDKSLDALSKVVTTLNETIQSLTKK